MVWAWVRVTRTHAGVRGGVIRNHRGWCLAAVPRPGAESSPRGVLRLSRQGRSTPEAGFAPRQLIAARILGGGPPNRNR